jgi:energy-coupling factor transporter transmembrane protein EcfT
MLLIVTILISTTKQVQLNYGFEDLLYPLKAFKAPIVE